jgi:hypothetical protein
MKYSINNTRTVAKLIFLLNLFFITNLVYSQEEFLQLDVEEIETLQGQIDMINDVLPVDHLRSRIKMIPEQSNLRWHQKIWLKQNSLEGGIRIDRNYSDDAWNLSRFAMTYQKNNAHITVGHLNINVGQGLVLGRSYGRFKSVDNLKSFSLDDSRYSYHMGSSIGDDILGTSLTLEKNGWTYKGHFAKLNSNNTSSFGIFFNQNNYQIGLLAAGIYRSDSSSKYGSLTFDINRLPFLFTGEISIYENKKAVILNIIRWDTLLSWTLHYRNIPFNWTTISGRPVSILHSGANEKAIAMSIKHKLEDYTITSWLELFSEHINKDGYLPNSGSDWLIKCDKHSNSTGLYSVQYRIKNKNTVQSWQMNALEFSSFNPETKQYLTIQWLSPRKKLKTKWQNVKVRPEKNNAESGQLLSMSYSGFSIFEISSVFGANAWNTDSWQSRLYNYSPGLKGEFYIPAYYGLGSEFFSKWSYEISDQIDVSFRHSIKWKSDQNALDHSFAIQVESIY